jgi:hypothetical protein
MNTRMLCLLVVLPLCGCVSTLDVSVSKRGQSGVRRVAVLDFNDFPVEPMHEFDMMLDVEPRPVAQPNGRVFAEAFRRALREKTDYEVMPRPTMVETLGRAGMTMKMAARSPLRAADVMTVDAVLLGTVTVYDRTRQVEGIRVTAGATVEMIAAKTGGMLWQAEVAHKQRGSLPKLVRRCARAVCGEVANQLEALEEE